MKILLINPSFYYQTPWLQVTEPLGILYLAAYIKKFSSHEVKVLDCVCNKRVIKTALNQFWYGISKEEMQNEIEKYEPDIIGITCLFSKKKSDFYACASFIKTRFPALTLIGGGTYPSLFPEDVINSGLFDYCVIGEGESTLVDLLNALADNNRNLNKIEGIAYKQNGEVFITSKTKYIDNLDTVPFPAREEILYENYITRKTIIHGLGLKRAASILTSRSCPNRCNFCSMFKIHGPKWRGRSAQNVINEMIELEIKYGVQELFIMDDNFTFKRDRVMEICEGILSCNSKIKWNTPNGIAISTLDKSLLYMMKKSGCKNICIAIESGDEELRNNVIGKHLSDKKIEEVTKSAAEVGIPITAFFIIGMPGETEDKFRKTLMQIKSLPLNGVAAAFANPLPGTKLFEDCVKNKWTILDSDENKDNVLYKPYIITENFTEKELLLREKRFYRTFIRSKWLTIIKDTLLFKNGLLYPPFLMRIIKDRLFRK